MQSQTSGEVLHLWRWQCLCQNVGHCVLSGTINKPYYSLLNHSVNKMIMHINMFCAGMVSVVTSQSNGRLVVTKHDSGVLECAKGLRDKAAQPKCHDPSHGGSYMVEG